MARQVKPFREHSQRWQREARAKGLDPRKWDRWRKLSPKSRKATAPASYASGEAVAFQVRKALLDETARVVAATQTLRGARRESGDPIKVAAVRRSLEHPDAGMTNRRLRQIARMPPQELAREIDDSLSRRYGTGDRSPFWYEKRG